VLVDTVFRSSQKKFCGNAGGAVDCVLTGEGETAITGLLDALTQGRANLKTRSRLRNTQSPRPAARFRAVARRLVASPRPG